MTIGLLQMDLLLRSPQSLKDKRSLISRIKNQVRAKFNVAIAELEYGDQYRRCLLGVTTLSNESSIVQQILSEVEKLIERTFEVQLIDSKMEMM